MTLQIRHANISIDSICRDAIFDVYQNGIRDALQKRLSQAFGNEWLEKVKEELFFKKDKEGEVEWDKMKTGAKKTRESRGYYAPIQNESELLGPSQFQKIIEKYYGILFPNYDPALLKKEKDRLLKETQNVVDMRNLLAHSGSQGITFDDAFHAMRAAKTILKKFERQESERIEDLIKQLIKAEEPAKDFNFQNYLSNLIKDTDVPNYVERKDIEDKLLVAKNIIVTGSLGVGKSSMLKVVVRKHAHKRLKGETNDKIPCFLNLGSGGTIIDEILSQFRGEFGREEAEEFILAGKFWIIFDGVDETIKFKSTFPKISSFIRGFPKNRYAISIRQEIFSNPQYGEHSSELKKFEEIRIEEFKLDEAIQLLRYELGEQSSPEEEKRFTEFWALLPDHTPLAVIMTASIMKDKDLRKYVYENRGRFYEQYFKKKLEDEVAKLQEILPNTDSLLESILIAIGSKATKQNTFSRSEVILPRFSGQ